MAATKPARGVWLMAWMKPTSPVATSGFDSFVSGWNGSGTYSPGSSPSQRSRSESATRSRRACRSPRRAGLEKRLADRLDEGEEPPVLAVDGEPGVRVARRGDAHRLEDQEREPLAQHARVRVRLSITRRLVAVVLLGGHVLVEVDLQPGLLLAARAVAARADPDLGHGDAVDAEVGGVVLVAQVVVAQRLPGRGSMSSRASCSSVGSKIGAPPAGTPGTGVAVAEESARRAASAARRTRRARRARERRERAASSAPHGRCTWTRPSSGT